VFILKIRSQKKLNHLKKMNESFEKIKNSQDIYKDGDSFVYCVLYPSNKLVHDVKESCEIT
jgi:hypothetical protein